MKIGEVCLLTNDVVSLSNFYKRLFQIDNGSNDPVHQFIFSEETTLKVFDSPHLTVYNDGKERKSNQ